MTTRKRQEWFDDMAQYKCCSERRAGWEWRPLTETNALGANPRHRMTSAVTWQLPVRARAAPTCPICRCRSIS